MQKDQFTKFANAENSSDPNQDKVVVELKEKKWGHRIATLAELKKASDITKQYLAKISREETKKELKKVVININSQLQRREDEITKNVEEANSVKEEIKIIIKE